MCYYFDDLTKFEGVDLDNTLIDEKSFENILVLYISYKTLIAAKPLCVRFNKKDGFIRVYNVTRYLVLFGGEKNIDFYNRRGYPTGVNSYFIYFISHKYVKIKVNSYNLLSLKKALTFHVIILIKSVFNKSYRYCYSKHLQC